MSEHRCPRCDARIPDPAIVGARLKKRRVRAGKSLKEIAISLGVDSPFLSNLEAGRRPWTKERITNYEDAISDVTK